MWRILRAHKLYCNLCGRDYALNLQGVCMEGLRRNVYETDGFMIWDEKRWLRIAVFARNQITTLNAVTATACL